MSKKILPLFFIFKYFLIKLFYQSYLNIYLVQSYIKQMDFEREKKKNQSIISKSNKLLSPALFQAVTKVLSFIIR